PQRRRHSRRDDSGPDVRARGCVAQRGRTGSQACSVRAPRPRLPRQMNPRAAISSALAGAGALWVARAARGVPSSIGASVSDIRPYAAVSPRYRGGRFHNTDPASALGPDAAGGFVKDLITRGSRGTPSAEVPLAPYLAPVDAADLA